MLDDAVVSNEAPRSSIGDERRRFLPRKRNTIILYHISFPSLADVRHRYIEPADDAKCGFTQTLFLNRMIPLTYTLGTRASYILTHEARKRDSKEDGTHGQKSDDLWPDKKQTFHERERCGDGSYKLFDRKRTEGTYTWC